MNGDAAALGTAGLGRSCGVSFGPCESCEVGQTTESRDRQPGGGPGGMNSGWAEAVLHL